MPPEAISGTDPTLPHERPDEQKVLVIDYGAQYAQLIARRVRECHVYSEIVPHSLSASEIAARKPAGIVLSGGPKSVHQPGAPSADPELFDLGVPILGICYGQQLMTQTPEGFRVTASTDAAPVAAFEDRARGFYGVQFHPEVAHTPRGTDIMKN